MGDFAAQSSLIIASDKYLQSLETGVGTHGMLGK